MGTVQVKSELVTAVKKEPVDMFDSAIDYSRNRVKQEQLAPDIKRERSPYEIESVKVMIRLGSDLEWHLPEPGLKRKPKLKYRPENGTVLDISHFDTSIPLEEQVELEDIYFLHHALMFSKRMVMITGAGVSVESGIPDFRSSTGLFQGLATKSNGSGKNLFDYNLFRNEDSIQLFEKMIQKLYTLSKDCKPSLYHRMIDDVSAQGRLLRLYTQNIDCLDTQLPHLQTKVPLDFVRPYPSAVQLHGNVKLMSCSKCSYVTPLDDAAFTRPPNADGRRLIVNCPQCEEMNKVREIAGKRTQTAGVLRPRIVLYNEFHPDGEIIGNITEHDLKSRPDCLIVTGTTLKIPGVRRLVKEMACAVHSNGGCVIWVNLEEPSQTIIDYVEYFDLIVVGNCQLLPSLVKMYDYVYRPKRKVRKVAKKSTR